MRRAATLGGFILIDRISAATVAAGLIRFAPAPLGECPRAGARPSPPSAAPR